VVEETAGALRIVSEAKSAAGLRTVTAPAFLVDEIAEHRARHRQDASGDEHALIFVGPRGGVLRRRFTERTFTPAVKLTMELSPTSLKKPTSGQPKRSIGTIARVTCLRRRTNPPMGGGRRGDQRMTEEALEGPRPTVLLLAGPNGAGETTSSPLVIPDGMVFINADIVARRLADEGHPPAGLDIAAGRVVLAEMRRLEDERASFCL
jgi:hypothetical protein